ncbi:MAG: class I SAM-dependent methyltransferase [Burkholderiales bacterium]|nr:MAG: class I SAM-dependent methyltransferase [Burkholderiales bacterium]
MPQSSVGLRQRMTRRHSAFFDAVVPPMNNSVDFFDRQFQRQTQGQTPGPQAGLNPFELAALPHLGGKVLDFGCGLGQLSVAAARASCEVIALDASPVAVNHLRSVAERERLPVRVQLADLRSYRLEEDFDAIVSIGLLMFFDCETAWRALDQMEAHLRPGGVLVVNVLVKGTTYMDMFDPQGYCLFERDALIHRFATWDIISSTFDDFPAPGELKKSFATIIARKPRPAAT